MRTRTFTSITEVRRDTARLIEQVRGSTAPVFITQYGYVTAVLLSPREYEDLCAAARLNYRRRVFNLLYGHHDQETAQLTGGEECGEEGARR